MTFQARFENFIQQPQLQELCKQNRDRIHLEFGLQTIHEREMKTIVRENNLERITKALKILHAYRIDFEVSIIYAIPGQTVESFIDTIEYLISNGCTNIKAYPLSIPKNSKLFSKKDDLCVLEGKNKYNVASVIKSHSFSPENRTDMDHIAEKLNSGNLITVAGSRFRINSPNSLFTIRKVTPYQFEVISIRKEGLTSNLINSIINDFWIPILQDYEKDDFRQQLKLLGEIQLHKSPEVRHTYINSLLAGDKYHEIVHMDLPDDFPENDEVTSIVLERVNRKLIPRRYRLKIRLSINGNIYVYREVNPIELLQSQ